MKTMKISDLNDLFKKAEETDREVFAEMRSNVLLVAGEHYTRSGRGETDPRTSRQTEKASPRLRLTKNHCHRLSQTYTNALLSEDPGVAILPNVDTDLQNKKAADLNLAVWKFIAKENKFHSRKADWAKNFVDIGEVCVKVFWDYGAGEFTGEFEDLVGEDGEIVTEDLGETEPALDEMGAPIIDPETGYPFMVAKMSPVKDETKPIFTGGFVWEEILPFNLLRDPGAKSMEDRDRPWIIRKMVDTKSLKSRYAGDENILRTLNDSQDETYVVFDANKAGYDKVEDQTMIREYYWRSSTECPRGYYIFATKDVVLEQGELPKGRWPFAWVPFNRFQSTPRGRSILKVARPYQVEINRSSSKIAEQQVSSDAKVMYNAGTKLTQGANLPGLRGVAYTGSLPTILPGLDGMQYAPYLAGQILEFDQVTMLSEITMKAEGNQMDPYFLMYQSAAKKRAHKTYNDKLDGFFVELCEITLDLAQEFLPDNILIPAVGQRETVNIPEFKKTSKLSHKITVEPGVETLEAQFGKQLTFQHMLQYVGKTLDPSTIGKMAKALPFGNYKDAFDDMTLDEDIAANTMLALERGEQVSVAEYIDPMFMLKRLEKKKGSPEFPYFAPEVKAGYEALISEYQAIKAEQEAKIMAAKNEYIPTDGALVPVQVYVQNADKTKKASLARLPYSSIQWLMEKLETQGASQEQLEASNSQNLSEMAELLMKGNPGQAPAQPMTGPQLVR